MIRRFLTSVFAFNLLFIFNSLLAQQLEWAVKLGDSGSKFVGSGLTIGTDGSDNIYTSGNFSGTADFDPGEGIYNLSSNEGVNDIFISKTDASGIFQWAKVITGSSIHKVNSMSVDENGNIYLSGEFYNTIDFDPGPGELLLTAENDYDCFVLKLDDSGNLLWGHSFGGEGNDLALSITHDNDGYVYLCGQFTASVDFDPGAGETILNAPPATNFAGYIIKLDGSGNLNWVKQINGMEGSFVHGDAISVDDLGNVYVSGEFVGAIDVNPGEEVKEFIPAGNFDSYLLKLDPAGEFIWAKQLSSADMDSYVFGFSIANDAMGNTYSFGHLWGTADFDPDPLANFDLTADGDKLSYILKLDPAGDFLWVKTLDVSSSGHLMSVDNESNIFITGNFNNVLDADPGEAEYLLSPEGNLEGFVLKLNTEGNFLWAFNYKCDNYSSGRSMKIDDSGNIYSTGIFNGTADFQPGNEEFLLSSDSSNVFITKMHSNPLGLTEKINIEPLKLYPNPSGGLVRINIDGSAITAVFVYNSLGQKLENIGNKNLIDLSTYPNGIYFVAVETDKGMRTGKLIKKE